MDNMFDSKNTTENTTPTQPAGKNVPPPPTSEAGAPPPPDSNEGPPPPPSDVHSLPQEGANGNANLPVEHPVVSNLMNAANGIHNVPPNNMEEYISRNFVPAINEGINHITQIDRQAASEQAKTAFAIGKNFSVFRSLPTNTEQDLSDFLKKKFGEDAAVAIAKYIHIAEFKNSDAHFGLGPELLYKAGVHARVFEDQHDDPIGDLLKRLPGNFDPGAGISDEEFDAAIRSIKFIDRARIKFGLPNLDGETVFALSIEGITLNDKDLKTMKTVAETGGDPNKYLSNILDGGGKKNSRTSADKTFKNLSKQTKSTISEIIARGQVPDAFKTDFIDSFIQELNKLRNFVSAQY